jgi:hypothetical protein
LTFDFDEFWEREENFADVDRGQLGHQHLNRLNGQRRRAPRIVRYASGYAYDCDRATGNLIARVFGRHPTLPIWSVRLLIDHYGNGSFIHPISASTKASRALIETPFSPVRPNSSASPTTYLRQHC